MASTILLVHHAEALGSDVDPHQPLSARGFTQAAALAARAKAEGVRPAAIWHSGKLRARQTADAFLRACNPSADVRMKRGLRPDDPVEWALEILVEEERDLLLVSHMPLLSRLLFSLAPSAAPFPLHGLVWLTREDERSYVERWRARI